MQSILPDLKICQEAKGIVKESKFDWSLITYSDIESSNRFTYRIRTNEEIKRDLKELNGTLKDKVSAPLTDEILKVLPIGIKITRFIEVGTGNELFDVCHFGYRVIDKKLSNALLLLAIKLVKEGIKKL